MRRLACGESSVPAASAPMSSDDSSSESGSSRMEVALSLPPPQPGPPSSSSGRARQRISTGALRDPVGEVLDQVEQRRLGPVDVLEDEHERQLMASASASLRTAQKTSSPTAPLVPVPTAPSSVRRSRPRPGHRRELPHLPAAGCLGHDLPHRPVGDALAIREAAARQHLRLGSDGASELARQACVLPIPASPKTVKSWRGARDVRARRPGEAGQLAVAADQRSVETPQEAAEPRDQLEHPPGRASRPPAGAPTGSSGPRRGRVAGLPRR